jgi:hypothetical protein
MDDLIALGLGVVGALGIMALAVTVSKGTELNLEERKSV